MTDPIAEFESLLIPAVKVRSFDDVVAQLRSVLLSGEMRPEDKLPSERELTRMLGVSRTTVREALRSLEARGLIEIRLGGTGGAFFRLSRHECGSYPAARSCGSWSSIGPQASMTRASAACGEWKP